MSAQTPKRERPTMKHYGISTEPDGLMDWGLIDVRLEKSRNYWVTSTRDDARPHAAPVWGIWHEGKLYFGSETRSVKSRNIATRPAIVIHLESGDDVVTLEGEAHPVNDETLYNKISILYAEKYAVSLSAFQTRGTTELLSFTPQTGMAWLETDFPKTATRFIFT